MQGGSANLNDGNVITPGDLNKLGDGNLIANSNFQVGGAGPAFNFQTSTPDRDSVFTGAGITAQFGEAWNTFFFYNADFGSSDFVSHSISGGLGVKF